MTMTVRLTVQRPAWQAHVDALADAVRGLLPVVKGNGYGFGRAALHPVVATFATRVCVGTVHELDGIPAGMVPIVLTPSLHPPPDTVPILTVGAFHHVEALRGWGGRVVLKLASSMHRYGVRPDDVDDVVRALHRAGLRLDSAALHLPLAGDDTERRREIEAWLAVLPGSWPLSVSHLTPEHFADVRNAHPDRRFELRLGTALWHGDKSFLHLTADVLDVATDHVTVAGYRHSPIAAGSTRILIGAGSANGVAPLVDGRSPFHWARHRIELIEAPHMHTSMGLIPPGQPFPAPGERLDVQRPLITTLVDQIEWVS
jgi:hypothetical protein